MSVRCASSSDDEIAQFSSFESQVSEFVWLAMNQFYYWQSSVPELDDNIASSTNSLLQFTESYSSPELLFDDLLHPDDLNRIDGTPFSWIVDDYLELEASFQGVSTSFGYEFRLASPSDSNQVFGFVKYVVSNSPAAAAALERGDLFTEVDGTPLTLDNYEALLFGRNSYTLTLGTLVDGKVFSTDSEVFMTAVELTENPIHLSKVIDLDGLKVGYLMYNQFVNNTGYHEELNSVFGEFVSEGVSEMVLDLRYNPGGSLFTTQLLASMLYGAANSSTVFGAVVYNEKLNEIFANNDLNYYYTETLESGQPLNRLNIGRLFVLTSTNTASASELVIAGLSTYLDVTLIGTTTTGKNVGSVTLYDSPEEAYLNKGADLNPNHRYALQPIVSQLANSEGFTDYIEGFEPTIEIDELDLVGDIQPLGDPEEHLLSEALSIISGSARKNSREPPITLRNVDDSYKLKEHVQTINLELNLTNTYSNQ